MVQIIVLLCSSYLNVLPQGCTTKFESHFLWKAILRYCAFPAPEGVKKIVRSVGTCHLSFPLWILLKIHNYMKDYTPINPLPRV